MRHGNIPGLPPPPAGMVAFAPWLMEPMRRNRGTYAKVALAAVMINAFGLVTSLFTMTIYDRVVPNNATSSLVALSIGGIGMVWTSAYEAFMRNFV